MLPDRVPTPETQPFWDGVEQGELRLPWCCDCGKPHFFPRDFCPHCWSESIEWRAASGDGTVLSLGIPQRAPAGFDLGAPFTVAIVELQEGPRMLSNVLTPDGDRVSVGAAVRLDFQSTAGRPGLARFVLKGEPS